MTETVLITGATGLLGTAITLDLLRRGYEVVATARREEKFADLREMAGENNERLRTVQFEFVTGKSVQPLLDQMQDCRIHHLVNNARSLSGLAVNGDGLTSAETFRQEFDLNVWFPYTLSTQLALRDGSMKSIVNIGSMYGVVVPNPSLYGGSLDDSPVQYGTCKAALHQLSKELAVRLAPSGIRVNCIAYGGFEGRAPDDFRARYATLTPARRMLRVEEAAGPVAFLISPDSSSVNGHVLVADGGWSIW